MENYDKLKQGYQMQFLLSSVFVCTFEALYQFLVERFRNFFQHFDGKEFKCNPKYEQFFRGDRKKRLAKYREFLLECSIINSEDSKFIEKCRELRNEFSHNLSEKLLQQLMLGFSIEESRKIFRGIHNMRNLLYKIQTGWLVKIEGNIFGIDVNFEVADIQFPLVDFISIGIDSITELCGALINESEAELL